MKPIKVATRQLPTNELLRCPHCRSMLDGVTGASSSGETPIPCDGDISVCCYCGTVLMFKDFGLAPAKQADWEDVEPELREIISKMVRKPVRFSVDTSGGNH